MAFILITAMHVILGELVPKLLAIDRSERLILVAARPLQIVHFAFRPAQRLFTAISLWLIRRTGAQSQAVPPITESELKLLLEDSHDDGVISKGEIDIIIRALAFADKKASDIMVPADRIDYLSLGRDFAQNLDVARLHRHSRLPLCVSGLDTIIGVVNMKDAWPALLAEKSNSAFERVARELVKLPLTLPQDAILRLFKERRSQIGIVRDNGDLHTLGVVTLEDVLESLIGDVRDQGAPQTPLHR